MVARGALFLSVNVGITRDETLNGWNFFRRLTCIVAVVVGIRVGATNCRFIVVRWAILTIANEDTLL